MQRPYAWHAGAAVLLFLLLIGAFGAKAGGQMAGGQEVADRARGVQPSGPAWLDADTRELLLAEGLLLVLVVLEVGLVVTGAAAFDSWRARRAAEAARLGGLIASALQHDRLLKDLAVTPVVHLPLWGRAGGTVELRGRVPTDWLRYAVLRTAALEAAKRMAACTIDDRLVIAPSTEAQAA